MSQPETLSLSSICALINPSSVYLVGYAWVLGMSIWITFFSGTIAFRALPRYQFGALQRRIFPVYFAQGFILPAGLLVLWVRAHPTVLAHLFSPAVADVAQAYSLASGLLMQAANHYIVGPLTTRAAYARYKQEKTEGKMYDEQGISDEMKALNARFNLLHAISVGLNLTAVAALVFHGLWIGNTGTGV
ncbi:uncharacterized protein C8Q71DRAFT_797344 [Rhodofomes roseus]|uniref:TMEM205-like domain-containing protein n=1 Tax=Rhodofomes roseus TaxID=34475 RepID=A0ABQ8KDV3_9APHY|nr:uncharacterized protein C8Q71DRAFT_797344 [Rhodofomes roseus]KAH9835827.1 hypothetical protein C8Q71DRAFT_797344 [Rhodofomes roseus]